MWNILLEQKEITIIAGVLLAVSLGMRMIIGMALTHLIKETDNMAVTNSRFLRQCRMKYENIYEMNNGVPNVGAFVEHCTRRLTLGKVRLESLYHISGQAMLLCVATLGVGVCKAILEGRTIGQILPYYLVCLLALYAFLSISALLNLTEKKKELKNCLVDYLENHLSFRMETVEELRSDKSYAIPQRPEETSQVTQEELEALLAEFLAN